MLPDLDRAISCIKTKGWYLLDFVPCIALDEGKSMGARGVHVTGTRLSWYERVSEGCRYETV